MMICEKCGQETYVAYGGDGRLICDECHYKEMEKMDELRKELDNYIYLAGGIALAALLYFVDKAACGTLLVAMGGAVLTKIKAGAK